MSIDYSSAATRVVTWDDLHRDVRLLADRLRGMQPFRGIVAVARGGLIPAGLLARFLDLRLIDTVCVASYDGRRRGSAQVLKAIGGDGAGWLIVDDLVDSGSTAQAVRAMLPRAHFATVYAKPEGRSLVDTFAVDVEQGVWLVFPWEMTD